VMLVRGGLVTKDMAMSYAHDREYVKKNSMG
jgi:hypothetical protein